jgi:hypothetical protein
MIQSPNGAPFMWMVIRQRIYGIVSAKRGGKLADYYRQIAAALALPQPGERQHEARAALDRIRRDLGVGRGRIAVRWAICVDKFVLSH